MSLSSTLEVLNEVPIFRVLDARRLRLVAMTGEVLSLRPGERLLEQGAEGDAAYVVLEGEVEILLASGEGERCLAVLGRGEIFGEMAVLTGRPRSTAVAARGAVKVLHLEGATVLALLREFPDLAIEVIKVLAERLEKTNALAV